MGVYELPEQIDTRKSAAPSLPPTMLASSRPILPLSAAELLQRFLPSVTIEEKVITTNKEKSQLQSLKQGLGRKYDGLSLQRSSFSFL